LRARRTAPEISEDIRQETLYRVLKIIRHGRGVEDPKRFGAFVNAICNNVLLEFMHKAARDAPAAETAPEMQDSAIPVDESLITEERKKAVAAVLQSLSAQDREILRMVFFDNIERPEICRRLGKDAGYIRVVLHRAKGRFEAAFQRAFGHLAGLVLLICNGAAFGATIPQIDLLLGRSGWTTLSP
jgi:RNA polymerase sigma-70 factor (ECF subfamily)